MTTASRFPESAPAAGRPGTPTDRGGGAAAPLVVTLRMDPASAAAFTALRRAHFPAHRNWLDAHITLFHALPGERIDRVLADIAGLARTTAAFPLRVDRLVSLGGGVAYGLQSADAAALRDALAHRWVDVLTRQDRARPRLHITVQNKVSPETARALQARLARSFVPGDDILATGIEVWHYENGPWRAAAAIDFLPQATA